MRFARVFLIGSDAYCDFSMPNDSLSQFVQAINLQGFIGPDGSAQVYIPLNQVRLIVQIEGQTNVVHLTPVGA